MRAYGGGGGGGRVGEGGRAVIQDSVASIE